MHTPHVQSGGRYPVLRSLAILYLIGAGLVALTAIIGAIWSLVGAGSAWLPMGTSPNAADRIISCVVMLTAGFFAALTMLAVAEVLKLFIDVEHNTRMAVPGRIGAAASVTPEGVRSDGGTAVAHVNRFDAMDEETAEGALLRGH
jgi:hypothetical protein